MGTHKPVVLITGSQGRIGKAIAAELERDYTIVGFERKCAGNDANCIEADITSEASLGEAFAAIRERFGVRIASVIHLAAFYDFSGEPNPQYDSVNVEGTRKLLQGLRAFQVEQYVYASTILVHAPSQPGVLIDEDSALEPKWPYPKSKLAAENVVHEERRTVPTVILRLAGVYTERCDLPALANQMQRIYERQMLSHVFPGDSTHGQSVTHLDDVAQLFRRAVERRATLPAETTMLVGETAAESYESLQNMLGRLIHGEPWSTHSIPKPVAASGAWVQNKVEDVVPDAIDRGVEPFIKPFMAALADDHYELDTARARRLLDWRPRHSLRATLPAMVSRLRDDPAGWYQHNHIPLPPWLEPLPNQPPPDPWLIAQAGAQARLRHQQTLWCHFANAALGLWLICSPFVFGLAGNWMEPATLVAPGSRGLPLSDTWMTVSDIASGALILAFAMFSLRRDAGWARWTTAALGFWLLFAPLVFWTPSAAAYANDTLVGALVMMLAVALPLAPGISPLARATGPDAPPGWDFSPSSWTNRLPIIALAFVGLFISRYLAAYQLGHIESAWDPFFGEGTQNIITSKVSEAWPISDAGLGAATYVLEIVTGVIGDKRRWRTMPWLVLLFGLLVVPLGAVSIFFIIIQPVVLGTWCTLCLIAAAAMLLQIPYSFDEIVATLQFLRDRRRQGRPLWYTLWHGDTMSGGAADASDNFEQPLPTLLRAMLDGVTLPATLAASILLGAALMASRLLLGTEGAAADSDHIVGALAVTVSVMALGEVARPLRLLNLPLGAWLMLAPWLLDGYSATAGALTFSIGALLVWLALPGGTVKHHYGNWDRVMLFKLRSPAPGLR
jgi:nucleoside-diphosphate-sugar epimerase/uncharacterized membrane protein